MNNFKKDEEGATLVFVGVCLAVLLGFAALTFDLGRVAATQSDMQAYADHVALAAAGELDGKLDSITRATTAAAELIDDRQTFGNGTKELGGATDYTLRFLTGLPADDTDNDLSSYYTNDPIEAVLVEVTTRDAPVFLPFYRAFGVLSGNTVNDGITRARAVAGFTQYACDIATLMFCLPSDPADLASGNSMRLRTGGNGAAWGPGNFGFLDPSDDALDPNGDCASLSGSSRYQCLIASSGNRTRCFAQRGVDMNTGQAVGIENAVYNTRFDIYTSTMNGKKGDPIFAPSLHRVTGYTASTGGNGNGNGNGGGGNDGGGNQCLGNNVTPSVNSMAFPPDACHAGSCGAFGGQTWDLNGYVTTNYGKTYTELRGQDEVFEGLPLNPSRYEVYKAEFEAAKKAITGNNAGNGLPTSNLDYSTNTCSTTAPSLNPDRRVFIAAGIDCAANGINGAKKGVPVEEYYEVFLMRPVGLENGGSGNFDLFVEMIGSAGGDGSGSSDDGGIFREVVELFR